LLTPSSHVLLEHYLAETGPLLATTPVRINPFVTYIIPLCYADDMLMHTVLALSGSHLCFKQPGNFNLERATYLHCASVLQSLRIAFQNVRDANTSKALRLLVILLMLCHFEVGLFRLQEKRDYIMQNFSVPSDHIFSSRDPSFAPNVMSMTQWEGRRCASEFSGRPALARELQLRSCI